MISASLERSEYTRGETVSCSSRDPELVLNRAALLFRVDEFFRHFFRQLQDLLPARIVGAHFLSKIVAQIRQTITQCARIVVKIAKSLHLIGHKSFLLFDGRNCR